MFYVNLPPDSIRAIKRKTANHTLVADDYDCLIEMETSSANTVTIPSGIFTERKQILISQYGAGATTIVAGSGMTLRSGGGKLKIAQQHILVSIIFISPTEAYVSGNLIT
jgi:hypothetical protein